MRFGFRDELAIPLDIEPSVIAPMDDKWSVQGRRRAQPDPHRNLRLVGDHPRGVATVTRIRWPAEARADGDDFHLRRSGRNRTALATAAPAIRELRFESLATRRALPGRARLVNARELCGHDTFSALVFGFVHRPQLGPALDDGNLADRTAEVIVAQLAADADVFEQIAHVRDLHDGFGTVDEFHCDR